MSSDPLDDLVSRQYEQWTYPAPIFDIPSWLQHNWQWFDPSHAHKLMWPDRESQPGLDILVAGCGTNQAAVIAYTNPTAHVIGIDVSDASLSHHRLLAERYALENLVLHQLPIERLADLGRDFDLIISTGVLHHLADPLVGMQVLGEHLRTEGVLAVMLYATYGRLGVQMLQSTFSDLGLGQDEGSVRMVRDAIAQLPPGHPLMSYLEIAPDLDTDAGLVDTFLHGRERTYTISECQDLVASAGLVFQDVFIKAPYFAPKSADSDFLSAVAALPTEQQWSVMERLNPRNACHFFLACTTDRPKASYVIDFTSPDALDYVPSLRRGCRYDAGVLHRSDWHLRLDPMQSAFVQRVDGHSSIAQITSTVLESETFSQMQESEVTEIARETFQTLWQLDFLAMGM
jgi:SAM-dependent methyltransferase